MKHQISFIIITIFSTILYVNGCKENSVNQNEINTPVDSLKDSSRTVPIVKVTDMNYDKNSFSHSFPDYESLYAISRDYSDIYSQEIKLSLIDSMKIEVNSLGENPDTFMECMNLTGCKDPNSVSLPTYAEKAKYNGEEAWVIQLVWGFWPNDLSHFKCIAIGIEKKDTLNFIRCR